MSGERGPGPGAWVPPVSRAKSDFLPAFSADNLKDLLVTMSMRHGMAESLDRKEQAVYEKLLAVLENQLDLMLAAKQRMAPAPAKVEGGPSGGTG